MSMKSDLQDFLLHAIDYTFIGWVVAAILDFVPHFSAIIACIWLSIRFYDYMKYTRPLKIEAARKGIDRDTII